MYKVHPPELLPLVVQSASGRILWRLHATAPEGSPEDQPYPSARSAGTWRISEGV
jgi:hypothetical protein